MPIRRILVRAATIGVLACCLLLTSACSPRSGDSGFVSSFLRTLVARALSDEPADASLANQEPAATASPIATRAAAIPDATPNPAEALAAEGTDDPEEGMCEPTYRGVVTVVSLRDAKGLGRAVAERGSVPVVYRDGDTVVYEDGQVLTTKLESVTTPLSELGWSGNPIRLLGSAASSSTAGSASTWSWNGARPDGTFKPKRTRRRG